MSGRMRCPIAWKEWREQRWRLAFSTVMLTGAIGSLAAAQIMTVDEGEIIFTAAAAIVLPLYSAMGSLAPERRDGTFEFYATKPAGPARVFFAKWFFGWLNVVVPVVAAGVATLYITGGSLSPRLSTASTIFGLMVVLAFGTIFYNLTCCLGSMRRGETFVGLCGLLVLGVMALYPFTLTYIMHDMLHISTREMSHSSMAAALFCIDPIFIFDVHWDEIMMSSFYPVVIMQSMMFALAMYIGYRKWRRQWRP
jgi:hypothetical protein